MIIYFYSYTVTPHKTYHVKKKYFNDACLFWMDCKPLIFELLSVFAFDEQVVEAENGKRDKHEAYNKWVHHCHSDGFQHSSFLLWQELDSTSKASILGVACVQKKAVWNSLIMLHFKVVTAGITKGSLELGSWLTKIRRAHWCSRHKRLRAMRNSQMPPGPPGTACVKGQVSRCDMSGLHWYR